MLQSIPSHLRAFTDTQSSVFTRMKKKTEQCKLMEKTQPVAYRFTTEDMDV